MFLSLLRISVRNVTRNTRRSLVTALAVLIGCFFIIVARGVLNGLQNGIVSGFTESQAGDIQIHDPDYLAANEALPLDKTFRIDDSFRKLMATRPEIRAYSGRIQFAGQISNGEDTTIFIGLGIDPAHEYEVCPRNKANILPGGQPVKESVPKGVVIGRELAESLNAKVGSELTLLVTPRPGGLNGMDVTVVGIAEFKLPGAGNKIVHIPLATAQRLLFMQDEVTEVAIDLEDMEEVDRVNEALTASLSGSFRSLNLVSNTWKDVGQFFVNANEVQDQVLRYVVFVMFIIMIAGIVNTMLMSVFERVREIGTMMAIGVRRMKILQMFLLESISLGSLGAVGGVLLGGGVVVLLEHIGLPVDIGSAQGAVIFPRIQLWYMGMVTAIAIAAAIVASLYPAWRAAKLRPAEALRSL